MPRAKPMTPALIAEAALRLGDRDGAAAMSMRRIATELGCDPMALYRHFANRQDLLDAVADLAIADIPDPRGSWEDRIRSLLTAIRSAALRHPGIAAHIAARPPLAENGRRLAVAMLAALTQAGLAPAAAGRAAQALVAYTAAALAMAVRAGEPDERWSHVGQVLAGLPDGPPAAALPVTGSAEQFEYGLRLLLAGIRAEATTKD